MSIDKSKKSKGKGFKSIFAKKKKAKKVDVIPDMEIVRTSADIEQNEDTGTIQVVFKTEEGIGRGVNRIPYTRLEEYIALLSQWNENPPAEQSRDSDLIAVAENTASVKDGILNHSWEWGKGKKPLRLKTEDIPALIEHLQEQQEAITAYLDGHEDEDEEEDDFEDEESFEDEDDLEDDLEDDD